MPPQPANDGKGGKSGARSKGKQLTRDSEVAPSRPKTDALDSAGLACERQWLDEVPLVLAEEGTLAEMRAARRCAVKAAKKYKVVRRAYQRRQQQEKKRKVVSVGLQQTKEKKRSHQKKGGYT
ncbi:hypothetical protein PF011_g22810 [Phytophthora fragariae]|uniref:Uncharacterized protein n=1 Tax=Phytophthora fragariae TaxID=53985 RepID=A0A6A3IDJ1_9STRA|nr:hypothetical protein PF011_g22810 [Phytophthora fragariae]